MWQDSGSGEVDAYVEVKTSRAKASWLKSVMFGDLGRPSMSPRLSIMACWIQLFIEFSRAQ